VSNVTWAQISPFPVTLVDFSMMELLEQDFRMPRASALLDA